MSLGSPGSVESRNAESRHSKNQREIGIVESRNPESQHSKKSKENAQHVVEVIFCIWFIFSLESKWALFTGWDLCIELLQYVSEAPGGFQMAREQLFRAHGGSDMTSEQPFRAHSGFEVAQVAAISSAQWLRSGSSGFRT